MRGLAIGRGLRRAGFTGDYRMFGPRLQFPAAAAAEGYEAAEIETDRALRHPHLAQASELGRKLAAFGPDLLLVDLFWAPLYWLLPALGCEAWLLVRNCPPLWLVGPPELRFDAGRFARILAIEPVAHAVLKERIDPIVIVNPDECLPKTALRERCGISADRVLVAVTHAGQRGEIEVLREAAADEEARGAEVAAFDLFDPAAPFPIAPWLPGADRIVSGLGYNSFWEARWLGYASRTRFLPFQRSIDDQARRSAAYSDYTPRENGADVVARLVLG